MFLQDFFSRKLYLDHIQSDITRLERYISALNTCAGEINRFWLGNRDKNVLMLKLLAHLNKVNDLRKNLHQFKRIASFALGKFDELGSLDGLNPPDVAAIALCAVFRPPASSTRISVDTTSLANQVGGFDGCRHYLTDSQIHIRGARDAVDVILNFFGLDNLLRAINQNISDLIAKHDRVRNGLKTICNRYSDAEGSICGQAKKISNPGSNRAMQVIVS